MNVRETRVYDDVFARVFAAGALNDEMWDEVKKHAKAAAWKAVEALRENK